MQVDSIAIVSGGVDSTTMLYHMLDKGYDPLVLTYDYGQRHSVEVSCARNIARYLDLPWELHKIQKVKHAGSLEGSAPIPKEDYSVETQKQTVSPNRNMIMLAIAAKYAIIHDAEWIWYAAHHNDHAVYPDCTPDFVDAMNNVLEIGNYEKVEVIAPFIYKTKSEIVKLGNGLNVPYEMTWSCYDPVDIAIEGLYGSGHIHCGVCGTCRERILAFEEAGVDDPTIYAERPKHER